MQFIYIIKWMICNFFIALYGGMELNNGYQQYNKILKLSN